MYELEDQRVEQALADDASRGVHVMVLLGPRPLRRWAARQPGRLQLSARPRRDRGMGANVALLHQKSIVIDRRMAVIMTLNLTPAYYSSSRDFAVLDRRRGGQR